MLAVSVKLSISALRSIDEKDYRILVAIEHGMSTREYVETRFIAGFTGFGEEFILRRLKKLNKLGLVQRTKQPYVGYLLTSRGYDCLALNALIKKGVIHMISTTPLGEGKESEVYMGVTPGEKIVAVKFHRVGRISFRKTKRVRGYIAEKKHISWIYEARLSATQEYKALMSLYKRGVSVPQPIGWNRHVVVTEFINGVELYRAPDPSNPRGILEKTLSEVEKAFRVGIIHGDLSEYNIMVAEGEAIYIIDWPQWIPSTHPQAALYLSRDVKRVATYMEKRFKLGLDPEKITEEFLRQVGL